MGEWNGNAMGQDPHILKCFVMHQVFAAPPGMVLLLPHCLSQEGTVSSGSTWPLPPNDSFSAGHRIKARVLPTLDCSPPSYTIRDQESDCRSAPGFAVTQNWARTLFITVTGVSNRVPGLLVADSASNNPGKSFLRTQVPWSVTIYLSLWGRIRKIMTASTGSDIYRICPQGDLTST